MRARLLYALSFRANNKSKVAYHKRRRGGTAQGLLREGDYISFNGMTGEVVMGEQEPQKAAMSGDLHEVGGRAPPHGGVHECGQARGHQRSSCIRHAGH
ncbi:hypothetical protein PR003_g30261 [Phytophthora rubi]|uniref:Uncharacterized protein n=1 Tax=Phytophthora rubi TaxID=129364 RepID=A0A6A3H6B8_9STRA|nr:hypothetical protein PR002_g28900 [Phytophthora rubi]KAE8966461.1 hypothetical protein PR001_g28400 [Phytophthora rubi]KAE9272261.1 hypothetical protein PR003_g30261 [Phytophthora rubi]